MTVTLGHLGSVTYAIQTSLLYLGVEVSLPDPTNNKESENGEKNLKPEICHPLKLLLGNYLSVKDKKPDKVIFYNGCNLCNLSAVYDVFLEIFAENDWQPEAYYFNVAKDILFIKDYFLNLKKISGASYIDVTRSIVLGFRKFFLLEYLDKVFYLIRPVFKNSEKCELVYSQFFKEITTSNNLMEYKKIKNQIDDLLKSHPPDHNLIHIGLIGDPFSLMEPFSHQYTDQKLGHLGVITDRWLNNNLIKRKKQNNFEINSILKNNYGVLTGKELKKLNKYIRKSYDGLVFIAPFSCNPNDALRNQLSVIQEKTGIPILSLTFDLHTSSTGLETRLEAFVDLVSRKSNLYNLGNKF